MKHNNLNNYLNLVQKMIVYNLRIIFANRFIWFLAGSVVFYLGLSVIYVFDQDVSNLRDLYGVFHVFRNSSGFLSYSFWYSE